MTTFFFLEFRHVRLNNRTGLKASRVGRETLTDHHSQAGNQLRKKKKRKRKKHIFSISPYGSERSVFPLASVTPQNTAYRTGAKHSNKPSVAADCFYGFPLKWSW